MDEQKNEIEFIDFLNIIWKRKWLIVLPTFFFVVVIGIISFLLPQMWEVDTIIVPSQILVQSVDGRFEEFTFDDPQQITRQINEGTFKELIANELNIDLRNLSKINAENFRDTDLIQISVKEKDVEIAKLILFSLFKHLKIELDVKAEIEKATTEEEIKSLEKKINTVKQRIEQIKTEKKETRKRIVFLENEQRSILKKEARSESESLALLLYSSEVQESIRDYNSLNNQLNNDRQQELYLYSEIEQRQKKIKRIKFTQFLKEPTSSLSPVSPNKKLNVLITCFFCLIIFTIFAFFLESLGKQKSKTKE